MSIKNTFQGMSSWSQLFFLCLFSFFGFITASLLSAVFAFILSGGTGDISIALESTNFLRLSQFCTVILWLFIPAYLCAYLYNDRPFKYLKINKPINIKFTVIAIALTFVAQPIISFTAYYNEKIKLPESMAGIENWIRATEKSSEVMLERLMAGGTISSLLISLFIIALMAAITEEFFFRGVMQQIFNKITNNYHWAIWITAFIFSAVHMQFLGFVPRFLLGALLGYLFVWSGNLWVPIIVHFLNNAMGVFLHWMYYGTAEYDKIENIGVKDSWWTTLLSVILTFVITAFLSKEYTNKIKTQNLR